jgi:Fe2+ or Zn2+ uptake regulation protein
MITASKKYEDMSMGEAILDLLNNHLVMEAKEIQIELLNNGFKSVSKTLLGDIYGRLSQLVSDGKIITFKDGKNFKKYKIATSQTNL